MHLQYISERDLTTFCNIKSFPDLRSPDCQPFLCLYLDLFFFYVRFWTFSYTSCRPFGKSQNELRFLLNKLLLSWEELVNHFCVFQNVMNCIFRWINYSSGKRTPELSSNCSPTTKAWELFVINKLWIPNLPPILWRVIIIKVLEILSRQLHSKLCSWYINAL